MIRVSYRRDQDRSRDDRWIGVLQDHGVAFVWCGHLHHNRDVSTKSGGEAAQVCARMILQGARIPAIAASRADQFRNAWRTLTMGGGFTVPTSVIEAAKKSGAERAAEYLALVEEVRRRPDLHDTEPAKPPVPPAPPARAEVGPMPDWMC